MSHNHATAASRIPDFLALIRFDRPIGTYLLLWPTLWALWMAAGGFPDLALLAIFSLGTFLMRSAGCAINDFADRHIDGKVSRTAHRPLATGRISPREALLCAAALSLLAFVLVLFTNQKTIALSLVAVALAACYPFMKRYTQLPQLVLGMAYSMGIPMAFAAQHNALPPALWLIYAAVVLWTVAYDTFYAMVDRPDDLKIGVKSTAILFGRYDRMITALLQIATIVLLVSAGMHFARGAFYFLGLSAAAALFGYQQWLIRHRDGKACFTAFLNNHYAGGLIFSGIALDYL